MMKSETMIEKNRSRIQEYRMRLGRSAEGGAAASVATIFTSVSDIGSRASPWAMIILRGLPNHLKINVAKHFQI